jgi:hypothetical protein
LDNKQDGNDSKVRPATECSFELLKVVEKGTSGCETLADSVIVEAVVTAATVSGARIGCKF